MLRNGSRQTGPRPASAAASRASGESLSELSAYRASGPHRYAPPVVAEHVGGVEHEDVERVALDPLAAVDQPAQRPDGVADLDAAGVLDRRAGAHLVGDRADAADARGDVGGLAVAAAGNASKKRGGS